MDKRRDNIPDIIESNGERPIIEILDDKNYKKELENKLLEECNEVINSSGESRIEELAESSIIFDKNGSIIWLDDVYTTAEEIKKGSYVIAKTMQWRIKK